jgi:two-component system, NarL family, response regulator LiaR
MMASSKVKRVVLVDDHDMVRKGLSVFLHAFEDFELVGEATNGFEAVSLCDELLPDIVLMDIYMPQMDGVTATQQIKQRHPQIRVIALTSLKDDQLVTRMLNAGADDYVLKDASIDQLAAAIRNSVR